MQGKKGSFLKQKMKKCHIWGALTVTILPIFVFSVAKPGITNTAMPLIIAAMKEPF